MYYGAQSLDSPWEKKLKTLGGDDHLGGEEISDLRKLIS